MEPLDQMLELDEVRESENYEGSKAFKSTDLKIAIVCSTFR